VFFKKLLIFLNFAWANIVNNHFLDPLGQKNLYQFFEVKIDINLFYAQRVQKMIIYGMGNLRFLLILNFINNYMEISVHQFFFILFLFFILINLPSRTS
jgi:hypothetical protein